MGARRAGARSDRENRVSRLVGRCPRIGVAPIVAAKREEVVKSNHQFSDIVKLIPTPGHTIDHFSVQVGKPGADAVITGWFAPVGVSHWTL